VTVAVDLDALGDTRTLWRDWLGDASRVLDVADLPDDRSAAAAELDARGAGNWRALLERFAEERAPVYLRPAAEVSAVLRALQASGARIIVFSDAPAELVRIALRQLGAERRVEALEPAPPPADVVVRTREELLRLHRSA
jgi:phosphoglycolate phosphatase-like HAD superfamily hydrolase